MFLYPYKISETAYIMNGVDYNATFSKDGIWVFDDVDVGLKWEAFVSGTNLVMDWITKDIPDAIEGFKLTFSDKPFDGYQMEGVWFKNSRDGLGMNIIGNWYRWCDVNSSLPGIEGWLCPALFLYFPKAPGRLYVRAEKIGEIECL